MSSALVIALDAGMPTAVRVSMAIVHLNASSKPATPSTIAALIGLKAGAVQKALNRLRDRSTSIIAEGGVYSVGTDTGVKGTDTGHPDTGVQSKSTDASGCERDGYVPGTVDATHAGVTKYPSYPTGIQGEGVHTHAHKAAANPEQVDAAPSAPLPHAEGLADVVQAWGSLTDPRGVQWAMMVRPADLSVLKSIHAEHGTALTLEGIAHIQANPGRGHRAPMVHYVRDRIETIKADRDRKPSQARTGRRGACDNLVGTTTPEERRAASYVDPEAAAAFWAKRAEVLAKGKAHVDALKAQGLME